MKLSQTAIFVTIASFAGTSTAFSVQAPSFAVRSVTSTPSVTQLFMADAVAEDESATEEAAPAAPKPELTGLTMAQIRKMIDNLTQENFSATLSTLEPYFLNEAGRTFYNKCLNRISVKAKFLGADMPADFAKEASCTAARRAKQDAFCKERAVEAAEAAAAAAEEAAAAEAAAAEEAAAAAASAEEEEAPAE
mmetsp:Transcript_30211/g.42809  ORF Transcript_30211/g.42809 Transcript_30211/m.42809 type:complete len:193 (+) Transcript_30211:145-723(+)|eukprot:CAMPEP_0202446388 /NCGR_PEP_ID=MMETSP1360-20130828/4886_1 /ASSEMBLY_ACC=CAM_ASM_000848 /TAXON_ID=515479 /ORGANISM="Licmophora paradoxa, Strain CCMP2313" /LENGTH=192 /DNA_ID=CAMNT_0049062847 /DNA_START=70 /DNA_END=648 /DNA_ORIENTATION=-